MDIRILYEDNHLLIVEKPVNVPVQQDISKDLDLLTMLKRYIKETYDKKGNVYLSLVHRLDRPVGGIILFAKTSKAASRMSDLLRRRQLERTYVVIVRGNVRKERDTLSDYLLKDRRKNQVYVVTKDTKNAKRAILHYETLARSKNLSLLKVMLETGRSHQIRVQLSEIGHPLYGDQKYGATWNKVGEQLALWAYELSFIHPVRRKRLSIRSMPPNVFPWNQFQINKNEI